MADQSRWFKLWCSAPADDSIQSLPPALRWAWAALGAYTKQHGTSGVVTISPTNGTLAAQLGVPLPDLLETLASLPSIYLGSAPVRWPHGHEKSAVCAGEFIRGSYPPSVRGTSSAISWCERHGKLVVTWKNWTKYQEDTTQAARGAASRSKKRGEEKRIKPPVVPPSTTSLISEFQGVSAYAALDVPATLGRIEQWCRVNGREMTRRRVVTWLNKDAADRVSMNGTAHKEPGPVYLDLRTPEMKQRDADFAAGR